MMNNIILLLQKALTPGLLKKEYREINKTNLMYGHCYVASEALYHLLKTVGVKCHPCCGKDSRGITHWWLEDSSSNIIDPTVEQYTSVGKTPPYSNGRRCGFLTRKPSKRAQIVIERVMNTYV